MAEILNLVSYLLSAKLLTQLHALCSVLKHMTEQSWKTSSTYFWRSALEWDKMWRSYRCPCSSWTGILPGSEGYDCCVGGRMTTWRRVSRAVCLAAPNGERSQPTGGGGSERMGELEETSGNSDRNESWAACQEFRQRRTSKYELHLSHSIDEKALSLLRSQSRTLRSWRRGVSIGNVKNFAAKKNKFTQTINYDTCKCDSKHITKTHSLLSTYSIIVCKLIKFAEWAWESPEGGLQGYEKSFCKKILRRFSA